jgi:GNAT superfamily N-acetyltransferase
MPCADPNRATVSHRYEAMEFRRCGRAGVGKRLAAAIADWARETRASEVALGFVDGNVAAERLYTATGFTATGMAPLPSNPSLIEVRMAKPIA